MPEKASAPDSPKHSMTPEQYEEAKALYESGRHSPLSIARCLTGVSYREIEAAFDWPAAPVDNRPEAYKKWLTSQPWVWRPDNQNPTEAPWERTTREFY
jgi:hypothetical protein